jgi:hypothetical protein
MNPRIVRLPEDLCQRAESRFSHRFGCLAELLTALLEELLREDALKMDEHDRQVIEERLKSLGYV